jgi:hypothetical protein
MVPAHAPLHVSMHIRSTEERPYLIALDTVAPAVEVDFFYHAPIRR